MAKAPTLLERGKAAPIGRSGAKDWRALLTPAQQKEFDEFMAWFRAGKPSVDRPTKKDAIALISDTLCRITTHTFDKYLDVK